MADNAVSQQDLDNAVALDDGAGQQVRIGAIDRDNNTMGGWQTLDATADGAEVERVRAKVAVLCANHRVYAR